MWFNFTRCTLPAGRAERAEDSMLRYLFFGFVMLLFTACSEMRIIGKAAMREFKADAVSREQLAYQTHRK